jgi:tetratricopeptide (TPR) repeat protein
VPFAVLPAVGLLLFFTIQANTDAYRAQLSIADDISREQKLAVAWKKGIEPPEMAARRNAGGSNKVDNDLLTIYRRNREMGKRWARYAPLESTPFLMLAGAEKALGNHDAALMHYRQAVRLSPANAITNEELAAFMNEQGIREGVEPLFKAALSRDLRRWSVRVRYGQWLIKNGRNDEGLALAHEAWLRYRGNVRNYIRDLEVLSIAREDIMKLIPQTTASFVDYAVCMEENGQSELAETATERAKISIPTDETVTTPTILRLHRRYVKQQRLQEALEVISLGIERTEPDARLYAAVGGLREKLDQPYLAIEAYQQALALQPDNGRFRKRLDKLAVKVGHKIQNAK